VREPLHHHVTVDSATRGHSGSGSDHSQGRAAGMVVVQRPMVKSIVKWQTRLATTQDHRGVTINLPGYCGLKIEESPWSTEFECMHEHNLARCCGTMEAICLPCLPRRISHHETWLAGANQIPYFAIDGVPRSGMRIRYCR
jgi:hypothetical protein